MRIEYLADYPQYVPTMASWSYQEWGWFTPGNSIHAVEAKFHAHRNRDTLPIAFVALEGSEVLGMASLRTHDMDARTDLTPWLGGVYVASAYRRQGHGRRLVATVEQKAKELGFKLIYLFTFDKEAWYSACGWQVLECTTYRDHSVEIMSKALPSY